MATPISAATWRSTVAPSGRSVSRNPRLGRGTVLAEADGEFLGFAHVVLRDDPVWGALVDNLHVRHDQKRRGIGRRLLGAVVEIVAGDSAGPPASTFGCSGRTRRPGPSMRPAVGLRWRRRCPC